MKQPGVVSDDFTPMEARDCPMSTCAAPTGSPCRTGKGKVAIRYHTARFRLVPQLVKVLKAPTPAVREPGSVWTELPRPVCVGAEPVGARPPRVRPRFDREAAPGRAARLPRRSRGHPHLLGEGGLPPMCGHRLLCGDQQLWGCCS
ncbi:zinc finger domain-containing protein [Microbispora rosea]